MPTRFGGMFGFFPAEAGLAFDAFPVIAQTGFIITATLGRTVEPLGLVLYGVEP